MSNNEGDILRKIVKASDLQVKEFAEKLGMTRQNMNYLFNKRKIGEENKEKVAAFLGESVAEVFDNKNDNQNLSSDTEKKALRDLVDAQKQIMTYEREILAAQMLRNEYLQDEILHQQVKILALLDPSLKKINPDILHKELIRGVEDKLKKDHNRIPLT